LTFVWEEENYVYIYSVTLVPTKVQTGASRNTNPERYRYNNALDEAVVVYSKVLATHSTESRRTTVEVVTAFVPIG
jgi:hypothetical protein